MAIRRSVGLRQGQRLNLDTSESAAAGATDASTPTGARSPQERMRSAITTWTGQLVDVGGRNNLLFYRDLRAGTLDLETGRTPTVESLLSGRAVRISSLFPDLEPRKDGLRRSRNLHKKARENFEERGIETLHIACGIATWKNPRSQSAPAAPVLLRPAELRPKGAAQDDFELILTGEMEVNPLLLHVLKSDFEREIPLDALLDRLDGVIDTPWELTEAYSWLSNESRAIPGFSISPRMVLGNFMYAKLPMVRDLEGSLPLLVKHDLVAAIAGDGEARDRLRLKNSVTGVSAEAPDTIKPEDEFLVLDADASQNLAINRILEGHDLIIKGPPGTGKSQTIANTITSLLAQNKKVLFVAEKRAAIDAVFRRLENAGLGDMLLDVHGGSGSRKQVAENLARALSAMGTTPPPPADGLRPELVQTRTTLRAHAVAMHEVREPWGVSLFELIDRASSLSGEAHTALRLRTPALKKLKPGRREELVQDLREFLELGGADLQRSAWSGAQIDEQEAAQAAYEQVAILRRDTIEDWRALFWSGLSETNLPPSAEPIEIAAVMELWQSAERVLTLVDASVFRADIDSLQTQTESVQSPLRHVLSMLSPSYRRAIRELKSYAASPSLTTRDLRNALIAAGTLRAAWTGLAPASTPVAPSSLTEITASDEAVRAGIREVARLTSDDDLVGADLDEVSMRFDTLLADRQTLMRLPDLRRTRKALLDAGFGEFLELATGARLTPDAAIAQFDWMWLNSLVEHLEIAEPVLARFDATQLRNTADRFAVLDRKHLTRTAARLMRRYAEHGVRQRDRHPDEAAMIQRQATLKRRHMPLRQLFQVAPNALLAVKPCWAMSPLVVSQVLPSDDQYFDVVIFDEASQVTPADAIPSIMRGRSVVVAGDDRQLPPTSFFMATQPEDEEQTETDALAIDLTKGFESVLDSLSALLPTTTLDWHYRSEDERLIAFSNAEFYDGKLITFPGISGRGSIEHVLVRGQGVAGDEESVSAEVTEVVRLILSHATQHPDETLGVIAMGITHANRIEEALRVALQWKPQFDEFFDEKSPERFFVKNLERVQGDERDAIILSVGYGKGVDGRMVYRFGPINLEGGERRLNVAVTRARRRMTVVSSFSAGEMDPERTTKRGPRLLREYLAYAEASGHGTGVKRTSTEESDLASSVKAGLAKRGIDSEVRIGSSSQWIDVAVTRPEEPSRYLLAVETDGPGYKANVTTRNRDRLRREQLERLGWRHMRLWSLEWFRDPEAALDRIAEATNWAMQTAEIREPVAGPIEPHLSEDGAAQAASRGPKPQLGWFSKIDDIRFDRLVALVDWIESDGLLRTEDAVLGEAVRELGFQRLGIRIETALRQAIGFSRKKRHVD